MESSESICWTARGAAAEAEAMDHVPVLWTAAYAPRRPAAFRFAARQHRRARCFLRALALADHTPSGGY
jgi:hypothetical protein